MAALVAIGKEALVLPKAGGIWRSLGGGGFAKSDARGGGLRQRPWRLAVTNLSLAQKEKLGPWQAQGLLVTWVGSVA